MDGEYFSIDFQAPEFIEPNAEIEIPVIFAPEESGNFEGTITVFSDDPRNEELTVAVSGSGVGPIISVMGRDIEFGRVTVGQSLQDDVLIRNRGLNNLIISDVNIEGQYFSTDFQDGLVIEPGGRHEMIVSFSPEEDGNFSAEISITSNDQDGDVVALDVSGMGFNGICFETPGSTHDLCVRDDMIFLADGRSGLQIVDIHDPYNPELVGELDLPGEVFGLEIHDFSEAFKSSGFKVFSGTIQRGGVIKAINAKGLADVTQGQMESLTQLAINHGAKGLAYIKVENGEWKSPIVKFFSDEEKAALQKQLQQQDDSGGAGWFLALLILALLGGGGWYAFKKGLFGKKKPPTTTPTSTPTTSTQPTTSPIRNFISTNKQKGLSNEEIRTKLRGKGWRDGDIDRYMNSSRT